MKFDDSMLVWFKKHGALEIRMGLVSEFVHLATGRHRAQPPVSQVPTINANTPLTRHRAGILESETSSSGTHQQ
ncbi:MAG: hypothetical protein ABI887_10180 [Burkholderiales bacterium]